MLYWLHRWYTFQGKSVFNDQYARNMGWCGKDPAAREKVIKALRWVSSDQGQPATGVTNADLLNKLLPEYERSPGGEKVLALLVRALNVTSFFKH